MKLVVAGYARHGKDTVCAVLNEHFGLTFETSSRIALGQVIWPIVTEPNVRERFRAEHPKGDDQQILDSISAMKTYADPDECYERRGAHRGAWYEAICWYNAEDPARLARDIFERYDVYCGIRSERELRVIRDTGLAKHIVWVDAHPRVKPEGKDSCTVTEAMCDAVVRNHLAIEHLEGNVKGLARKIGLESRT